MGDPPFASAGLTADPHHHEVSESIRLAKRQVKNMSDQKYLDPQLSQLLGSLRSRVRRYVVIDSLLAVAAVVLLAFWLGLALDYLPVRVGGTEMPRLARTILLFVVAIAVLMIVGKLLIGRLHRPLPDDSLALLIERQHPSLGGRLVTAVQLNRPGRSGDAHSPELLRQVHQQAAEAIDQVDPNRVFRWEPLFHKSLIVVPLVIGTLIFLAVSPQAFLLAASRLSLISDEPWPRRADLRMVGIELPRVLAAEDEAAPPRLIEFEDRTARLPKGSSGTLRIQAAADTAELPVVCTVHYRGDDGTRGQTNMRRVGRVVDGFQSFVLDGPPLSELDTSFDFSVRGLDDRLDDYRVEAVDPPAFSQMAVEVRYPDYLRNEGSGAVDLSTQYEAGLRVPEGSDVTMVATSTRPLGEVDIVLKTDTGEQSVPGLQFSDDRKQVSLPIERFGQAATVWMVPRDRDGISAQAPYRYFLGLVLDEPPTLKIELQGIGSAVTPIARIPVTAEVADDYGVEKLELSIASQPASEDTDSPAEPAATASVTPPLNRDGEATVDLDLRELAAEKRLPELAAGGSISLFGEASDRYDLGGTHLTRSELFRLQLVTPEQLLALLERRELGLRARLEQTITEAGNLRDTLDLLRRRFDSAEDQNLDEAELTRELQLRRLRTQQSDLQASKTSEELSGIAASLDDILSEMINNRVDSVDRRERIAEGVRDPLQQIVEEPLARLRDQIDQIEEAVDEPEKAAEKSVAAVESAEQVLLRLGEVLDKMLDLESYNEILDMVRELKDDQQGLLEETKQERKKKVLDLFQ